MTTLEVFADITCPFTHVGLKQVTQHVATMNEPAEVIVRAWPLEWVNGAPLEVEAVITKAAALSRQLGVDDFRGLRHDHWPDTTIPALHLAGSAYQRDAATGLAVSLELRSALFEEGLDIADSEVLAAIAARHDLDITDPADPMIATASAATTAAPASSEVTADFELGQRRGVKGSPHFFVGADDYFCPALDLGHDDSGHLTARFDQQQLAALITRLHT